MSLEGQVVVVTAASAGVGRAAAREFGRRGAHVVLVARGEDRLAAASEELRALGVRALPLRADVADPDQVEEAAWRAEAELGPIDVWVNCAMTAVLAEVTDTQPEELRRVAEVTYLGSAYGTMAALRRMLPRDRGTIVQVGSALARRGIPLQASYCGAKHALQGFLDSLRVELRHQGSGVRLTTVQLPGLNTPQFGWVRTALPRHPQPVPPIYQPQVAARAVAHAAEHPRRELWVGTSTVWTILGSLLTPTLYDRYLARTSYEAQQSDIPVADGRVDNLFDPPTGDPGSNGIFDDQARARSLQFWINSHRPSALGAGAAAAVATLIGAAARRH